MLVVTVTTPWSSATPWAACLVCVTPEALCLEAVVTCAPDSARVEREWRACSAPTVPTATTTGVYSSAVRGHRKSKMRDGIMTVAEIKWISSLYVICTKCPRERQVGRRILLCFLMMSNCAQPDGWSQGCVPCTCEPRGTVPGSVCDSSTGQCVCLPTRYGRDCSRCRHGKSLQNLERPTFDPKSG